MKEKRETSRHLGIDSLRILSMWMIVIMHVLRQSGLLYETEVMSTKYEAAWLMEIAAYCAVNCYALISGYVGYQSKVKYDKLLLLWLQVFFYTLLITGIFAVFKPGTVNLSVWKRALFPMSQKQYWYFTAYFALFFFMPALNLVIQRLERKELKLLLGGCFFLFSIVQTIRQVDLFDLHNGYSVLWLIVLYLMGGYLHKYGIPEKVKKRTVFFLYIGCVVVTWAVQYGLLNDAKIHGTEGKNGMLLISYLSPTISVAGIALFLLFAKLQPKNVLLCGVIRFLAPLSFSVYLIHVHPLLFDSVLKEQVSFLVDLRTRYAVPMTLVTAAVIYLLCSLIDKIRLELFRMLHVPILCQKLLSLPQRWKEREGR